MAAELLGMVEVPTLEVVHLSEAQKRAYIIADNKIALESDWDMSILEVELQDIAELDFDISLTGFDDDFLIQAEPEGKEVSFKAVDTFDLDHKCPKCGYEYD